MKILTTGTFDILHSGHLDYLEYAKSLGDYLVVHIESDEAVKRHKGNDRPVNNEEARQRLIKSLKIVDQAFIADGEKDYEEILRKIKPDIFIIAPKSNFDLKKQETKYREILPELKIVWFHRNKSGDGQKSSSKIINKINLDL
jgi:D-beta-D-heptose 7-phosphate kinase/D-beta-D-heptose 1-phosphate adenosyltransferase